MCYTTGLPNPSRETKFSGANGDGEILFFPVQLTTSRIGNLTHLNLLLLCIMTIYTYMIPMYVCMYVCRYVCMHVCMYVFRCVCMYVSAAGHVWNGGMVCAQNQIGSYPREKPLENKKICHLESFGYHHKSYFLRVKIFFTCSNQLKYQLVGGFFFFFFYLTYSRWTSSLPSCLWSQRIFPSLPGSCLTIFLSRCKFTTLTTRQPMVEFYLLTFPRFPLRKKEHKSYFGRVPR